MLLLLLLLCCLASRSSCSCSCALLLPVSVKMSYKKIYLTNFQRQCSRRRQTARQEGNGRQLGGTIRPRPTCCARGQVQRQMGICKATKGRHFYKLSESLLRRNDVTLACCVIRKKTFGSPLSVAYLSGQAFKTCRLEAASASALTWPN